MNRIVLELLSPKPPYKNVSWCKVAWALKKYAEKDTLYSPKLNPDVMFMFQVARSLAKIQGGGSIPERIE